LTCTLHADHQGDHGMAKQHDLTPFVRWARP
jgi:hypothetical protein